MPSNKDRLYIGIYVRGATPTMPGGEDKYHWALLTGPKGEGVDSMGMRYHATQGILNERVEWYFEALETRVAVSNRLLIRVMIAKVEDSERLSEVLRLVPIRAGQPGWNCVLWIKEALQRLREDNQALGRRELDWDMVRDAVMEFSERKHAEHVFDGTGRGRGKYTPTYDLLSRREIRVGGSLPSVLASHKVNI